MAKQIEKIRELEAAQERAADWLLEEARRLIPTGTAVSYEFQRMNRTHRVYGVVKGHGISGSRATFFVENELTGKVREVSISAWRMRVENDNG